MAESEKAGPPGWEDTPFRNQPATFNHTLVYVLGDCLRELKTHRDRTTPKTSHHNLQLIILACSFFEAALNRGLVNAALYRLGQLPRTPEYEGERRELRDCLDSLVAGDIYGNPFGRDKVSGELRPRLYSEPVQQILGVNLIKQIPAETAAAVRCLFLLRNITVHGQTVSASGILPVKVDGPIANYRPRPSREINELERHLRNNQLVQPMTLTTGVAFPFLNDWVANYFFRALVGFFRVLQDAVTDEKLRYEFGAGIPQDIFPILAGESFEL